jgi:hypothetical protein
VPKTLQVNPGVIIRIKIDQPIDMTVYAHGEKHRLMDEVFQIMNRNLEELRRRRKRDEERQDAVFRWIYGAIARPEDPTLS